MLSFKKLKSRLLGRGKTERDLDRDLKIAENNAVKNKGSNRMGFGREGDAINVPGHANIPILQTSLTQMSLSRERLDPPHQPPFIDQAEIGVKWPSPTLGPGTQRRVWVDPSWKGKGKDGPMHVAPRSAKTQEYRGVRYGHTEERIIDTDRSESPPVFMRGQTEHGEVYEMPSSRPVLEDRDFLLPFRPSNSAADIGTSSPQQPRKERILSKDMDFENLDWRVESGEPQAPLDDLSRLMKTRNTLVTSSTPNLRGTLTNLNAPPRTFAHLTRIAGGAWCDGNYSEPMTREVFRSSINEIRRLVALSQSSSFGASSEVYEQRSSRPNNLPRPSTPPGLWGKKAIGNSPAYHPDNENMPSSLELRQWLASECDQQKHLMSIRPTNNRVWILHRDIKTDALTFFPEGELKLECGTTGVYLPTEIVKRWLEQQYEIPNVFKISHTHPVFF